MTPSSSLPQPRLAAQFEGPALLPGLAIDNTADRFAIMRYSLRRIWVRAFKPGQPVTVIGLRCCPF